MFTLLKRFINVTKLQYIVNLFINKDGYGANELHSTNWQFSNSNSKYTDNPTSN